MCLQSAFDWHLYEALGDSVCDTDCIFPPPNFTLRANCRNPAVPAPGMWVCDTKQRRGALGQEQLKLEMKAPRAGGFSSVSNTKLFSLFGSELCSWSSRVRGNEMETKEFLSASG